VHKRSTWLLVQRESEQDSRNCSFLLCCRQPMVTAVTSIHRSLNSTQTPLTLHCIVITISV
jgi:hypothetical protein